MIRFNYLILLIALFCQLSLGGTVKVFVLAGQSNAQGHGDLGPITTPGTLEHFYANKQSSEFDFIKDNGGNWATRSDVWVRYFTENNQLLTGDLKVGYGGWSQQIGPEYGMGHALGEHFDDQVLIVKTCWGGKNLAVDFRPPSAGGSTGPYYTKMISDIRTTINNIDKEFPGYNGETVELAGFVWFQGWNDGERESYKAEYESNLLNLIKDIPADLGVPDLPIIVGLTGNGGREPYPDGWIQGLQTRIVPAQIGAVESTPHSIIGYSDTRDFWIDPSLSPSSGLHHWNSNAESYLRIGYRFGEDMISLLPDPVDIGDKFSVNDQAGSISMQHIQGDSKLFFSTGSCFQGNLTVKIANTKGQNIYSTLMSKANSTVDVSLLSTGVYFVSVFENENWLKVERFVKR